MKTHEDNLGAFTIAQFGQTFGLGMTKIYALIKSGELRAVKVGKKTLIMRSDAEAWAKSLPELTTF
jgi:excisionase family DNA binding protein